MEKLEERARAICAQDVLAAGCWPTEIQSKVDELWPVVAREITGGAIDPVFAHIEGMDARQRKYEALCNRRESGVTGSDFHLVGAGQSRPDR